MMTLKLKLCTVLCDFTPELCQDGSEEKMIIDNKREVLLEVLQCMSINKWNSIELLKQCIETISKNLFRSLPEIIIRKDEKKW